MASSGSGRSGGSARIHGRRAPWCGGVAGGGDHERRLTSRSRRLRQRRVRRAGLDGFGGGGISSGSMDDKQRVDPAVQHGRIHGRQGPWRGGVAGGGDQERRPMSRSRRLRQRRVQRVGPDGFGNGLCDNEQAQPAACATTSRPRRWRMRRQVGGSVCDDEQVTRGARRSRGGIVALNGLGGPKWAPRTHLEFWVFYIF